MQAGLGHQHSVRVGIVAAFAILLLCFVQRSLQRADAQYTGLCTPWESVSCDGTPSNGYVPPSERPCDRGCYNGGMSLGYRWEAFDLHVDPRVAWIPPDLPPATNDPRLGTLPLVPADAAHLTGPTPFAERPVHNGLMDAVLGTRMLQVTDFELPSCGASASGGQSWTCRRQEPDLSGPAMVPTLGVDKDPGVPSTFPRQARNGNCTARNHRER